MSVKIGVIGAGSAVYALSVVKDVCLTTGLRGSTVTFMDVNARKLNVAFKLAVRYAAELGAKLRLEKTTERAKCLRGADFVINTALAAGGDHPRLREGWGIARGLGYRFGGSLHVMHDEAFWVNFHQLRLMESIARDILKICPRAWLLQVANPVFAGTTWLMRHYPRLRMVGLCHGYLGVFGVSDILGLKDHDRVDYEVAGVNHFIWMTRMRYRGRNMFPLLDRWIKRGRHRAFWGKRKIVDSELNPVKLDLYRTLGVVPIGDTAHPGGGAWPWWYHADRATERRWREDAAAWWRGHFRYCREEIGRLDRILRDRKTPLTQVFGATRSGESIMKLVDSIVRDVPCRVVVNTLNAGGWVPGIPRDVAVEFRARVDGRGIHGVATKRLPGPVLACTMRDLVSTMEMELLAYGSGNFKLLLELVKMDPWTRSQEQAERLVRGILARHPALLHHYR